MSNIQKWQNDISEITQHLQQENWEKAEQALDQLETKYESRAELLYLRSLVYMQKGNQNLAIQKLEDCIQQFPDYSPAMHNLSVLYWQSDKRKRAIALAQDAYEADPDNKQTAQNLLDMLIKSDHQRRSANIASQMLVRNENQPDLIQLAATLHIDLDEPIKAKYYIDLGKKYQPENMVWDQLEDILGEKLEGGKKNQKNI
ncbi:MAG: tetratricopeptide repeat protein [Bacteroidota bacterium]